MEVLSIVDGLVNSGNPFPSYWWGGWVEWKMLTNLYVAIVPLNPNLGYTRKRVVNEQPAITDGLTIFCSSPHAHRFSPSLCSTFRVPRKVWFWLRSSSCTSAGLRWVTAWRPAMAIKFGLNSCPAWKQIVHIPVVPHKAVAEVSKIGRYRRGELLWCMDGRANPLMDRKVVGVVLFGVVAVVTSTTTAGCSVL